MAKPIKLVAVVAGVALLAGACASKSGGSRVAVVAAARR